MKKLVISIALLSLVGCSVGDKIVEKVGNDLVRTSELAATYNKPQVKKCTDWMVQKVQSIQSANETLDKMRSEKTDGIISAAFKAAIIAEQVKALQDSSNSPLIKAEFKSFCSEVAGDVMFNVIDDAARIGKKIN
jgi:hypothetical protein